MMTNSNLVALFVVTFLIGLTKDTLSLDNGLALKPPMGWISWERFTCETDCVRYPFNCINHHLYEEMAGYIRGAGYQEVGYEYVNIDDCWSEKQRDENNGLVADKSRFPNGIDGLSQAIHSLGLKMGIYGDCGTATCANYPAQLKTLGNLEDNYFEKDAKTFAEWQIDSFKFDGCNIDPKQAELICPKMSLALNATERPILVTCEWPFYLMRHTTDGNPDFELAAKSCNLWRYYEDVQDSWQSILNIVDWTVKMQNTIVKHHGPGHWFDPDQLVIGNFGLSLNQARAQMALWSIWSAPLFMSNDLREIELEFQNILKKKSVIDIDQDPLGIFGLMVADSPDHQMQVFVKPVMPIIDGCPSFALVYLNRHTLGDTELMSYNLRDLVLKSPIEMAADRYQQVYGQKGFDGPLCRKKIKTSMTRDKLMNPVELKSGQTGKANIEVAKMMFEVTDLFTDEKLTPVGLNSSLSLEVNPNGVRMVILKSLGLQFK